MFPTMNRLPRPVARNFFTAVPLSFLLFSHRRHIKIPMATQ